jgi:hypothetical protein
MKKILQQQAQTIGYAAGSAATPFKIGSQSYWITSMLLGNEMAKTGAATTATQDYLWRIITNLQLVGGGTPYLSVGAPDTRILYWDARLRSRGIVPRTPDMVSGSVTMYHPLPFLPGTNPVNPDNSLNWWDVTAPVRTDTDLTLSLTWAANSVIASATNTIATTTALRLTLAGVVLEAGDAAPQYKPEWGTVQYAPTQTYTGLGGISKLATGFQYRRTALMFLNGSPNTDNRSNGFAGAAISEVGVVTKDGRFPLNMKTWDFVRAFSQHGFHVSDDNSDVSGAGLTGGASVTSAAGMNAGVGLIDWASILKNSDAANPNNPALASSVYGANLVSKNDGTLSLGFTVDTATNTSVVQLHEKYARY